MVAHACEIQFVGALSEPVLRVQVLVREFRGFDATVSDEERPSPGDW